MLSVPVNPELIRWAIDRSGLPADSLVQKFPKLDDWRSGKRLPTLRQLESFAKATMTPFGFLLLERPPEEKLSIPDFRTLGDTPIDRPSPNLLDTIHTIERRQAWMRDFLIEEGHERLAFVGMGEDVQNARLLAIQIREALRLETDWAARLTTWQEALSTLRSVIEQLGVLVFSNSVVGLNNHRPLNPEEFRGFVLCDPYAPTIFVNSADSKSAQMFTLAHELAHVWLGKDGLFNLIRMMPSSNRIERLCNRTAAELLIPGATLRECWEEVAATTEPFQAIARRFKVSPLVAARRALDLQLIDKGQFFAFYQEDQRRWQQHKADPRKKPSGGNFYDTQASRLSGRFARAVVRAVREGRLLYRDAYRLTDLKGETFNTYAHLVLERMKNEGQ